MTAVGPSAESTQNRFMDPFNFPMPSRKDLMSLSTINASKDYMKTTTNKFNSKRSQSTNLSNADIEGKYLTTDWLLGSKPKLHGSRYPTISKPQWNLSNLDIDRSQPRSLHLGLSNKPDNQLKTQDIKWANPQCVKFTTSRQATDPLNPNYKLQSASFVDPVPPKFLRDQQNIADIPGAKAVKAKQLDFKTRDILNIGDI